jgi:hypothetical protein
MDWRKENRRRSKRAKGDALNKTLRLSRSVKRLDDASAFVGREENLLTESKREVRKAYACRGGKTEQQRAQSVSKSMFQEGAIERKMQRVKETHSVDRVHPSCYAIPT